MRDETSRALCERSGSSLGCGEDSWVYLGVGHVACARVALVPYPKQPACARREWSHVRWRYGGTSATCARESEQTMEVPYGAIGGGR